jgi:hypothetical protein
MFDAVFSKNPEPVALGTFVVLNGNVLKGTNILVSWFNDTTVLVPMNARNSFTLPTEHQMFDQLLMALASKAISINYIVDFRAFMDPKARFNEFLAGTLDPATVGIKLTKDEQALPALQKSVVAKFDAVFTPSTPLIPDGVDIEKVFGKDMVTAINQWRKGSAIDLPRSVTSKIRENQKEFGLLRVKTTAARVVVENDMGHKITKVRFLEAYNTQIKPAWDRQRIPARFAVEATQSGYGTSVSRQPVTIHENYIEVGCQMIPRAEVERTVALLNLG